MRKRLKLFAYFCILFFFLFNIKCKKDELIKVTKLETGSVTDITYTTATASATFTDLSGNVTEFGHCWNTSGNPTTSDPRSIVGGAAKKGDFSSNLTGLSAGTRYYVKAYAIDGGKPVYGNQEEFTTNAYELPVLTTEAVTSVTYTSALSGGDITSDGGRDVTARGVCWSTSQNPTISDRKTNNGTGTGTFISYLTGLTASTTYYARAYATNSEGTAYGNQQNFTTDAYSLPIVSTESVSDVTHNSAVSGGNVTSDGGSTVTVRGVCWGTSENPTLETNLGLTTDGNGTGTFVSALTGLTPDNDYHVRAYATNVAGTSYGADVLFSTLEAPSITITSPVSGGHWIGNEKLLITWTTTNVSGNLIINLIKPGSQSAILTNEVQASLGQFEWTVALTQEYRKDYTVKIASVDDAGIFAESEAFTLSEASGTTGTIYGNGSFYFYSIIKIGYQWWMSENLKDHRYPDGTVIPDDPGNGSNIYTNAEWAALEDNNIDDACCFYNNSSANLDVYGRLYTYAAAIANNWEHDNNTGQGICPDGWHLPSVTDWTELENHLADYGYNYDGTVGGGPAKIAKAMATENGWNSSAITGAVGNTDYPEFRNKSGFSITPGGNRTYEGSFSFAGYFGRYWLSNATSTSGYIRNLDYDNADVISSGYFKSSGCYVRCVRD